VAVASTTIVKPNVYRMYFLSYSEAVMVSPPVQSLVFLYYYQYNGYGIRQNFPFPVCSNPRMQLALNDINSVHNHTYYLIFILILSRKLRPVVFSGLSLSHFPLALCISFSSLTYVPQSFATSFSRFYHHISLYYVTPLLRQKI
jgi:hypothetical protein